MEKFLPEKLFIHEKLAKGDSADPDKSVSEVSTAVETVISQEKKEIEGILSKFSPRLKKLIIAGMTALSLVAGELTKESYASAEKSDNKLLAETHIENIDSQIFRLKREAARVIKAQHNGEITWPERAMQIEKINKKILILENLKKQK
jgi:hypothetical protein